MKNDISPKVWGLGFVLALVATGPVQAESILGQADKKAAWKKEVTTQFDYMNKNPLEPWPDLEPGQVVQAAEPPKAKWKAQKPTGEIEYPEKSPDPGGFSNVWCRAGSGVQIQINYVGMGTVDGTPKDTWARVYWNPKNRTWGMAHPNELAFKQEDAYAEGLLSRMEEAVDAEAGRKALSLSYDVMNYSRGTETEKAAFAAKRKQSTEDLQQITTRLGQTAGVGDLFWKIHALAFNIDAATSAQKVSLAKERRALLRQAFDQLAK
ncbi:MAG: hypothetical protein HY360_04970 [Verrucomicrobia bacterium]|nr:hypothetical protein [Verrucomicrobiota bacterium]